MSYKITLTNGNILTTIPDTQLITSYGGLSLVGHKYPQFGTTLNTNLVRMTENFSSSTSPNNPLVGQFWYDSISNTIKFWNGKLFKSVSNITNSSTAPLNPEEGDEWFNTTTNQFTIWSGNEWIIIGPDEKGNGLVVASILINGITEYYLEMFANDNLLAIFSTINMDSPGITGFNNIRAGINFATSSLLGYVEGGIYNATELTLGNNDQIHISIDNEDNSVISTNENTTGGNVIIVATNGIVPNEVPSLTGIVYTNSIIISEKLSFPCPGSNTELLFNNNGVMDGTASIKLSDDLENIEISHQLSANSIIANNIYSPYANIINIFSNCANISNISVSSGTATLNYANISNISVSSGTATLNYANISNISVSSGTATLNYANISNVDINYANISNISVSSGTATLNYANISNVDINYANINNINTSNGNVILTSANIGVETVENIQITGNTTLNWNSSEQFILPNSKGNVAGAPLLTDANGNSYWSNISFSDYNSLFSYGSNTNGFWEKNNITGKIEQWGELTVNHGSTVTFPIEFTNLASIAVFVQIQYPGGHGGVSGPYLNSTTLSSFRTEACNFDTDGATWTIFWRAIGY
jgi:uncharacterized protein YjbI with pentapeptide repeats